MRGCGYKLLLFFNWYDFDEKIKIPCGKLIFIEIACRHFLHQNSHRAQNLFLQITITAIHPSAPLNTQPIYLYKSQPLPALYVCPSCLHAENSQILTSAAVCLSLSLSPPTPIVWIPLPLQQGHCKPPPRAHAARTCRSARRPTSGGKEAARPHTAWTTSYRLCSASLALSTFGYRI